jgi:hypothetical protein
MVTSTSTSTSPTETIQKEKLEVENNNKNDNDDNDDDDDKPDEWDQRIINTGCADENLKLQLCHYDTNDWRKCIPEMEAFRKCWDQHNNNERTLTVDNPDTKL